MNEHFMKAFFRSILLTLILISGCKDPFTPALPFEESNFLVVEGYIDVGEDAVTTIKLSRTTQVKQGKVRPNYELGASVSIINDIGEIHSVIERGDGQYSTDSLFLPLDRDYRLRIVTANEREYYSEFTKPLISPEIDSVYWQFEPYGVRISVATHDPVGETDYYQWDFEEVWETPSPFLSIYTVRNRQYVMRDYDEIQEMRTCWKKGFPTGLVLASSTSFVPNSLISKSLVFIPLSTEKLGEKYSILVRQHALNQDAYDYLRIMEKNATQVGSFFDPQPSQLSSNISSTDSNDPVVGYIGAYTTSKKRIIIKEEDLPHWDFYIGCDVIGVTNHPDSIAKYHGFLGYVPVNFPPSTHDYMIATNAFCVDCRLRGGKGGPANKPDFWDE